MDINGMSMLKRNFKYSTLATAICLLYAPTTFAHIEKVETDTLTVIGQQDNQITDFQSVVDTRSAQAQTASTTGQLLKQIPGITVSGTGIANGGNIMMRGYDQRGVKIFVDGIHQPIDNTMNKLGGLFIDPPLISRVKVKHGGSSVKHGSGALGGVVSFSTLHPNELLDANKNLGAKLFSSFSSADKHFSYGGVIAGRHQLVEGLLAYSQRERGPIRIADDSILNNHERIKNYFAKAYVYPTEEQTVIFSARQYNNAGEQREVLNRMGGYGKRDSNNMYRATKQNDISLTYHLNPNNYDWLDLTTQLYYSQFKIAHTFLTDTRKEIYPDIESVLGNSEKRTQYTYGMKVENAFNLNYFQDRLTQSVIIGIDAEKQKMVSNNKAKNFPLSHMDNASGWVHNTLSTPLFPITLIAGLRYNYYQNVPDNSKTLDYYKDLNKKGDMTSADKYQETYQNISKNIALRLTLTKWLQIYSSYSVAFRAPTLSEMYNDSVHFTIISPFNKKSYDARWVPNSTLEPETNRTWEHGINLQKNALLFTNDQLNIKASYYSTESIDHITYQQWYHSRKPIQLKNSHIALSPIKDARETTLFQSVNLPKALIHGFDLRLLYSHPYIAMGVNYNQTKTLELSSLETISMVRPETLTAFINVPIIKTPFSVAWSGKFAGPTAKKGTHKYPGSEEVTTRLKEDLQQYPGYGVHSFAVNYQSNNKDIQASLVLDNAFNKLYYSTVGVPQEARNIKMSVSYRW